MAGKSRSRRAIDSSPTSRAGSSSGEQQSIFKYFRKLSVPLSASSSSASSCNEMRKQRQKQHSKKAYAKNAQKMRGQYDKERAVDIIAFRSKLRQAKSWTSRNKARKYTADDIADLAAADAQRKDEGG
ncbi:hypothetical protein CONLIGDRAFT_683424 [Coniochaeta ligniaria NRRL 30616]|uniref:Uncharacterized protein n=1 Tax=Coniochaeta ligniaria NRRL 30616 TaxID=1408157 RepID=A0A1J7JFR3_9PEZI|nr:hypothetical protein CONLIGDRAFT_683424 [Coniochaeta ligniaria NRRL 30616]